MWRKIMERNREMAWEKNERMMEWKKNDRIQVRIEDVSDEGLGIGRTEGYAWFIKDTVIGDLAEAGVMKMKKTYGFARLIQVLEPSPWRIEPKCPVARACGGCQLQAMDYQEQLRFKERKIYHNLRRIGGLKQLALPGKGGDIDAWDVDDEDIDAEGKDAEVVEMEPIIGMENPWRYRNKAQFPFGKDKDGRIVCGFYAGRTHAIIETDDCLLGVEENREILNTIRTYMEDFRISPYEEASHTGLVRHALIRKGFSTGELMVCLVINGKKLPDEEQLTKRLRRIKGMHSISYNINQEKTNVILGKETVNLYGPGYITDKIGDISYRISPKSFYQVNPAQTKKLYDVALEYAELSGNEVVWDLYCGIGTISLFLAQKAKMVYGVEVVPEAIEDARQNARQNGIENAAFFVGKAEEVLPEQFHKHQVYADVIVVDPPRKGCDKACLDTIVEMAPKRVVYVSCDSATLARDVKYLGERGYEVTRVRGVDQFGWGVHVETVVLLTQKNKRDYHVEIEIPIEAKDEAEYQKEQKKATYTNIKNYIKERYGVEVHSSYIAQVRRLCGLDMRECYNKSKKEIPVKVSQCPDSKAKYIREALAYFEEIR